MTCHWCPFEGCDECAHKGGTACATTHFGPRTGRLGRAPEHETAPESRQRFEGLTTGTSPFDLTEGGKPMASRNVTPTCVREWPDPGHEDEGYSCVTHNKLWSECGGDAP